MDNNNWRQPAQGGEPPMDNSDWRTQLQADSRHRIVNKIMETLKRHLPFSGQEGLQELKKIAVRFEEKIYTAATSQSDYLRKISLKMLTMENKSNPMPNPMQSNSAGNGRNSPDPASQGMQSQVNNPGQSLPIAVAGNNQSQALLGQNNIPNGVASTGMQGPSVGLNPAGLTPAASSLSQSGGMTNVGVQNSNLQNIQNMSGVSQNPVGNSQGGVSSNMYVNSQRQQMQQQQVRQQQQQQPPGVPQQQQQSQNSQQQQQFLFQQQQQLQHQMIKQQKYQQQGNIPHSVMQSHIQQQQNNNNTTTNNNLLQQSQMQSSPQSLMQPPVMQSSSSISGLQQNQQSSVQQSTQPVLQQQLPQSVLRQQRQQQQAPIIHQQPTMLQQPSVLPTQQQQQPHLMGQPNTMQQNQLNNIPDMQHHQQQQQQRLIGQQNNLSSLQQQQLMMGQPNNLANMQQQHLGPQSNLSGLQQQQQQQQLLATQSANSGMQTNQHSMHMVQQPKVSAQQQTQQNSSTLLQTQNQQSQPQAQQQMVSQIQSQQPGQLQQQMSLQQQPNPLQRDMQQRIQTPNPLLQQQSMIDQQKQQQQQMFQQQRPIPEASSTSLDSTAGNANGGDSQEEVYQKIKSMKEAYFGELSEMFQKISGKLQMHESIAQNQRNDQLEKFKTFKTMLERLLAFLQLSKAQIGPSIKDKVAMYEKQILQVLNSNRPRKPGSSMPPTVGLPPNHLHAIQQQQPQSQMSQHQQQQLHENQMNAQIPSTIMMNSLQASGPKLDPGQSNNAMNPSSLQQPVASGSLQQNPVVGPQQPLNMNPLSSQGGMSGLQPSINPLQSNLQHQQHLKQQEQMMQTPQFKQQFQQRQMQQQQQFLQKQQMQQQQQQFHHQQKPTPLAAAVGNQTPLLHQMSDGSSEMKMRQQMGGVKLQQQPQQHHSTGGQQRAAYHQMKQGAPFSISSPQLLQPAGSPQISQHPSPQIDQQNLLNSLTKAGTPLQSANSPFIVPSPSTPLAPSPMPGESEKVNSGVSSLSNTGNNIGHHQQTAGALVPGQSIAIGTPGISASPLLAEFTGQDGNQGNGALVCGKSSVAEQPLERLLKAVKSMTPQALSASVGDIGSVVSMIDRIAGSAPGNGSRAAVGEDLVAMTKCRLQARNFITQDGSNNATKKVKRYTSAMPLNVASSAGGGSVNDTFKNIHGSEASDLESTATSNVKKPRLEVNHALVEEIKEINQRLIDTVVDISNEDIDPMAAGAAATDGCEGTIVKCTFSAVALSPNLKSQYASAQMSPIQPLRLLVPTNYPNCSPVLLDKFPVEAREHEDLSVKAKSRFSISLRGLSQPMSLGEIARTWDICARAVISEYAEQSGGGSFSSKYGTWENCLSAA